MPAGALAGVGLIEFNWGGPPYDGGFLGDLALFGGFLALGQAPLVALFVLALCGRGTGRVGVGYVAAVLVALSWPPMGLVGWTMGSYLEVVGFATPLYSNLSVLAGVLPWLLVGTLEGLVLVAVLASLGERRAPGGGGPRTNGNGGRTLTIPGLAWVLASVVGGFLHEYWSSLDIAALHNPIKDTTGAYLEGVGVAENVAYEVVPAALSIPMLYGVPTGLALFAIHRLARPES